MIIDSSAILAVIGQEPGYERIIHQLAASPENRIGAPARRQRAAAVRWRGLCQDRPASGQPRHRSIGLIRPASTVSAVLAPRPPMNAMAPDAGSARADGTAARRRIFLV
jgi:uncharacterized protein with PIN domain